MPAIKDKTIIELLEGDISALSLSIENIEQRTKDSITKNELKRKTA